MCINNKIFRNKFEKLAKKLNITKKYHIHRSLSIKENRRIIL